MLHNIILSNIESGIVIYSPYIPFIELLLAAHLWHAMAQLPANQILSTKIASSKEIFGGY